MRAALPSHAFRPGQGGEPDSQWLENAKSDLDDAALVQMGFALLRAGYFWESHELLEKAWLARAPNSPEREMLRAVIQIANGLLKVAMGNRRAAAKLFAESIEILAALAPERQVFDFTPSGLSKIILAASEEVYSGTGPALARLQALPTCIKMQDN